MRLLCLDFPTLPVTLIRRARPHLAERPLVLIAGTGADAAVTAVSPAAATRGVAPGMSAATARERCQAAMFLPDNVLDCIDEIERIAAIIRRYATLSVAIASSTQLMIDVTHVANEEREARRLVALARQWTRMEVRAGVGSSAQFAAEAAAHGRRTIAVDTRPAPLGERPPVQQAPITGRVNLVAGDPSNGRRLRGLAARLASLQEAYGQACRDVKLRAVSTDMTVTRTLRFDRPIRAVEAVERLEKAVATLPGTGGWVLEVELAGPVPLSLIAREEPMLAAAV